MLEFTRKKFLYGTLAFTITIYSGIAIKQKEIQDEFQEFQKEVLELHLAKDMLKFEKLYQESQIHIFEEAGCLRYKYFPFRKIYFYKDLEGKIEYKSEIKKNIFFECDGNSLIWKV